MLRRHTGRLDTTRAAARPAHRRLFAAVIAVAAITAAPAGAQTPVTLTFDAVGASMDPANGINYAANCYVEMGIRVMSAGLPCGEDPPATFGIYTPAEALGWTGSHAMFNSLGASVDFMAVNGGPFSLFSLELAPLLLGPLALPTDVMFTGFMMGGGTVMQTVTVPTMAIGGMPMTYTLNGFTNLSSVRMTPGGPDFAVQFDNVNGAVVPEPATVTLVALGLVGLAAGARRRRALATR